MFVFALYLLLILSQFSKIALVKESFEVFSEALEVQSCISHCNGLFSTKVANLKLLKSLHFVDSASQSRV